MIDVVDEREPVTMVVPISRVGRVMGHLAHYNTLASRGVMGKSLHTVAVKVDTHTDSIQWIQLCCMILKGPPQGN